MHDLGNKPYLQDRRPDVATAFRILGPSSASPTTKPPMTEPDRARGQSSNLFLLISAPYHAIPSRDLGKMYKRLQAVHQELR